MCVKIWLFFVPRTGSDFRKQFKNGFWRNERGRDLQTLPTSFLLYKKYKLPEVVKHFKNKTSLFIFTEKECNEMYNRTYWADKNAFLKINDTSSAASSTVEVVAGAKEWKPAFRRKSLMAFRLWSHSPSTSSCRRRRLSKQANCFRTAAWSYDGRRRKIKLFGRDGNRVDRALQNRGRKGEKKLKRTKTNFCSVGDVNY